MNLKREFSAGIKAIFAVGILYAVLAGALFYYQRDFLFLPSSDDPFTHNFQPLSPFDYTTTDDLKLRGMWHPPKAGKPTIILFHGNGGNLSNRLFKAKLFLSHGYGIALVGYHGYDGNPGFPSEQNFYDDGRAAIKAIQEKNIPDDEIILYGESIGTGVATQMATEMPNIKALILEASYTSVADVAEKVFWFMPTHLLIRDKFKSIDKINSLQMPVLLIHGTDDKVIPYIFGQTLFKAVASSKKQFISLQGAGHNDLYDYGAEEAIHLFIEGLDNN